MTRKKIGIDSEILKFIKDCQKSELPWNRNRSSRAGGGVPLSAWMLAARGASKINDVVSCLVRYPYKTFGASSEVLAGRIADRYEVSAPQARIICEYVSSRYRGVTRESFMPWLDGVASTKDYGMDNESYWFLKSVEQKTKKPIPLNALISEQLTNMVLLRQVAVAANAGNQNPMNLRERSY